MLDRGPASSTGAFTCPFIHGMAFLNFFKVHKYSICPCLPSQQESQGTVASVGKDREPDKKPQSG
jgi:hypothetical protein